MEVIEHNSPAALANARLIAAAPELLAALERAADMLERVTRRGAFVVGCDAAAKQARAALAKAGA